jgi:hypothetical protein
MKRISMLSYSFCLFSFLGAAQNTGIGTLTPLLPLHVASASGNTLLLENTNTLNTNIQNSIIFSDNANSGGIYRYTGAIRSIGTSDSEARLGFFTFANSASSGLQERLTILDNGYVGINKINPAYPLEVSGDARIIGYLSTSLGVTVGTDANVQGSLAVTGMSTLNGNVAAKASLSVVGNATVANGKGIVRSNNGTQQKIVRTGLNIGVSNMATNTFADTGVLGFEAFGGVPLVTVGACTTQNGEWYKMLIVPFNVTTTGCQFRIFNAASDAITVSGAVFQILVVGAQ